MDHIKIIKRAFQITLDYRALWVFGIILALTAGTAGGNFSGGNTGDRGNGTQSGFWPGRIDPQVVNTLIAVGVALCCLLIVFGIAALIGRYLAEVALIRMVNSYEETGEKVSVKQGFRLGWSRAAWRVFVIDLMIGLAAWVVVVLLMLVAAMPLLVWLTDSPPLQLIGTVTTIGLTLLFITFVIIVAIVLNLLLKFIHRACVLEDLAVIEAIKRGVLIVRQRLGDVIIMALIMFGLGLAWMIVMIPIALLLIAVGVIVAGLPALFAGMIAALFFTQGAGPWIVAAVVGLPIFILILSVPSLFLGGLEQVFVSTVWTLTYREAAALAATQAELPGEISSADDTASAEA